jgi:two-component system, chemotaxis family, response regulator Rcp1
MTMKTHFNVLIVEDNPGDVALITTHLKKSGFECCYNIFHDGESALNYLHEQEAGNFINKPNLIILDLNLPRKSGHEVLQEIKTHNVLKEIPIIIFSSSEAPDDIAKAYQFANSYVIKPYELDKYDEAIRNIYNFWFQSARLPAM